METTEKTLILATTNQNKLKEVQCLLPDWQVKSAADIGYTEDVAETGETFVANALLKARAVAGATGHMVLADDSGLCVDALDGAPGIFSARYSGQGSVANRELLLKNLAGKTNRRAHFTCAMALCYPDGREFTVEGQASGTILESPRGNNGFGYDCLFLSDDLQKSFAEATPEEKNAVSHRAKALKQVVALLTKTAKQMQISLPRLTAKDGCVRLECDLNPSWVEKKIPVYLEMASEWQEYLTTEVADCWLVNLLPYALTNQCDLCFAGDLSEDLYFRVTTVLIPVLCQNIPQFRPIKISCRKLVNPKWAPEHVGTGISCGVDSFYTIYKNRQHSHESGLNVDTLCYFNNGSAGGDSAMLEQGEAAARAIFNERKAQFDRVAQELNCRFLWVDTNINEFLQQRHAPTHVYRTLGTVLALQKYFRRYYFSSGEVVSDFSFRLNEPAYYDLFSLPQLATRHTQFESVGGECTRLEKMKFIVNYPLVQQNLNVCCVASVGNEGHCEKCRRTLLELDALGVLDQFAAVFNVADYRAHQKEYRRWALLNCHRADIPDLLAHLRAQKAIKFSDRVVVFLKRIKRRIKRFFKKKL